MAGGLFLFPKKLVRKSDWMRVDLPSPDSPTNTKTEKLYIIAQNKIGVYTMYTPISNTWLYNWTVVTTIIESIYT